MNIERTLEEAGLTSSEANVYLALLKNGASLAGRISRLTGIHRRNVYDITERLIKKGVIGYILRNNRRYFEAANPDKFLDILKEKENSLLENLSFLKEIYSGVKEKQETNFYKGVEGLKNVFQDQLNDNKEKEILILGASKSASSILPFYFKWYNLERAKKRIKLKIIASERFDKKISLSEARYLPQKYANPLAINIYKDKVAIVLWKKSPIAIVIKEKEIADSYKKYFEAMWHMAR